MTWKPGQSGNPSGLNSRKPFQDAINMEAAMRAEGRIDRVPALSVRGLIRKQWEKAAEGDLAALTYLSERVEGKPRASLDVQPIEIAVGLADDARVRLEQALGRLSARVVEEVPLALETEEPNT